MTEESYLGESQLRERNEELQKLAKSLSTKLEELRNDMDRRVWEGNESLAAETKAYNIFPRRITEKVKTPVNGMLGMLDVIKPMETNPEIIEYLNILEAYNLQLLSTVSDIIDYAFLRSGSLVIRPEWTDVADFAEDVSRVYAMKARGKALDFKIEMDPSVPGRILADRERLLQLLGNLIDNAINHTKDGEISIQISNLGEIDQKVILAFRIQDSGTGIDPAITPILLEALSQKDSGLLLKLPGDGLGLLIVKELCNALEGEVSFESDNKSGTVFWVTLPFARNYQESAITPAAGNHPRKILLVEDNYLNQRFARATLSKAGHQVDIAENGKVAIQKFQQNNYDLILMDIQLPILDGIDATMKIRELEKESGQRTAIIAVTAYALERDKKRCLEAGMDQFLAKPFKPWQLLELIEKSMGQNI